MAETLGCSVRYVRVLIRLPGLGRRIRTRRLPVRHEAIDFTSVANDMDCHYIAIECVYYAILADSITEKPLQSSRQRLAFPCAVS